MIHNNHYSDIALRLENTGHPMHNDHSQLYNVLQDKIQEQSKEAVALHINYQMILVNIRKSRKKRAIRRLIIPPMLLNEKFVVMELVKSWAGYLGKFTNFCNDYDVVLAAVSKNGSSLQFLPKGHAFCDDFQIAYQAVNSNFTSYQYLSDNMKMDRRIVLRAVKSQLPYGFLPIQFKKDREIMLEVMKFQYYVAYKDLEDFLDDGEIVIRAKRYNTSFIGKLSERLRNDYSFIEKCTRANPECFLQFPKKYCENFEIVKRFSKSHLPLSQVPEIWRSNLEIVTNCVSRSDSDIAHLPRIVWKNVDFLLELVAKHSYLGYYLFYFMPKGRVAIIFLY